MSERRDHSQVCPPQLVGVRLDFKMSIWLFTNPSVINHVTVTQLKYKGFKLKTEAAS